MGQIHLQMQLTELKRTKRRLNITKKQNPCNSNFLSELKSFKNFKTVFQNKCAYKEFSTNRKTHGLTN